MKIFSIKKNIAIFLTLASLVIIGDVFAQQSTNNYLSNIYISESSGEFNGVFRKSDFLNDHSNISNDSQDSIILYATKSDGSNLTDVIIEEFSPTLSFAQTSVNFSSTQGDIFLAQNPFDQLFFAWVNQDGEENDTIPVFLNDLGIETGGSFVDFPGWSSAEYQEIPANNTYYPYVSVGNFQRTPSDIDLYLILENIGTNQKTALETYPGGSQFLSITWPVNPPTTSYLVPGASYKIYLSSSADGSTGPVQYTNQSTQVSLGQVPSNSAEISIDNAEITNGDTLEITGTAASNFAGTVVFKILGSDTNSSNNSLDITLGSLVNPNGQFTFPETPQTYALGGFDNYTLQALVNNNVVSEFSIGENSSNTNSGNTGNTNAGNTSSNGSSSNFLNDAQSNIVANGIVVTDCGYNLNGKQKDANGNLLPKGKICGFSDAIRLIQRVIEYIFILVLPIMAIMFAYAGYLYLTSGGSKTKRDAAKKAMTNSIIGVVVIMAAWLIVKTIVVAVGVDVQQATEDGWFFLSN